VARRNFWAARPEPRLVRNSGPRRLLCLADREAPRLLTSPSSRTSWGTRASCRSASPRNACRSPARERRTPPRPTPRGCAIPTCGCRLKLRRRSLPQRTRGRRRRGWLLAHASESEVRLQFVADQAGSKHTGDSRNRGKGGQPVWPITTPDRRGRGDAHLWRISGASRRAEQDAFMLARTLAPDMAS
jgi:hypothetical protein